ncbi:RIP metalloprotease RseP [Coraliomargarita parva]|uniref:RIP metalloprotease RseP n=1 Tax=Coraliomargarita parva TaxID=3014050 RepID=UPI0022B37D42|nr:RIP metalloprotease RseP [Coraliomargarita parva]
MAYLLNFWYIAIALFCLGFCIFIHELGHFIAAKKRGLIADRFSIGFGPRLFGWHRNGTDFRISLLPLGGYVSLPQLADMGRLEGGEGDEADKLPPISYADKMIVAVMGAVFNLILAFGLSLILWWVGQDIIKSTEVDFVAPEIVNSEGAIVPGPAFEAGLKEGDIILKVDNEGVGDWMQFNNAVMTGTGRDEEGRAFADVTVLRDEQTMTFRVYPALVTSEDIRYIGVDPGTDLVVSQVQQNMPAAEAGLLPGDKLLALDDQAIASSAFLSVYLSNHEGGPIDLKVLRNGEEVVLPIVPKIAPGETQPRFGFAYFYEAKTERVHRNPIEQIGIMANTMRLTLVALVHKSSDVKVRNMSGPVGIVHGLTSMARYGWIDVVWFLALINVNLAIFNLLPIPVLDGGHMLFATISKLIGRPLPRKLMENLQVAFVVLLLSFVAYVSFYDVKRVGVDAGIIDDAPQVKQNAKDKEANPAIENTEPAPTAVDAE